MEKLKNQLDFLAVCDALKTIERQTFILDKTRLENSAEHSWHSALAALVLFEHCVLEYAVAIDRFQSFNNNRLNKGAGAWEKYSATAEMIINRNLPIKKVMPSLWHLVESTIEEGLKEGFVNQ